MTWSAKTVAASAAAAVLLVLAALVTLATFATWGISHLDALMAATAVAVVGFGVLYPLALIAGEFEPQQRNAQEIDIGPATMPILF